jgi:hypothetical protein
MQVSRYITNLQAALRARVGCECSHLTCGLVHIKQGTITVWRGMVETFALTGHPTATHAYAWGEFASGSLIRGEFILNGPTIDSPEAAVRSVLARD